MTRRALLSTTPVWILIGCSAPGTPPATQLTNSLTVGEKIDAALLKVVSDISAPAIGLLTPTAAAPISGDLTLAGTALASFLGGAVPSPGGTTLAQVNAWFGVALNAAAPILAVAAPEAIPIVLALEAVDALLPVFELAIPGGPAVAQARISAGRARIHARAMAAGPMSPDEALMRLATYTGGK